jgi:Calcineurin-like phosphoesterase superfamily domain
MRTAIVSDLHLGSAFGEDLLREPSIRRTLLEGLAGAERLVLLGDAVETRELPLAQTLERVRPFFEELGEAMEGRQVILVPGNHDHRLAEPLLEREALAGRPLGLEHQAAPSGVATEQIATWLGGAELQLAYPGIWLREDVYATHGHYMDCHMSLPRLECVAAAGMMRAFGPLPERPGPADYERVLRPVYGFSFGLSQSNLARRAARPSERAWQTLSGRDGKRGRARRAAIRAAIATAVPAGVWSVNRMLHAEFRADLSAQSISRSGIDAATELAARLDLDAAHLLTGHTHRGGPEAGEAEWELPGGGRLHNTGSWVFASAFHRPGTPPGPYWPGTITWLEDEGSPRRVNLLLERPREELRATVDRLAT